VGSRDLFRFFGPPRISGMAEAGHSGACGVHSAFHAVFAKLLWPLVTVMNAVC